MQQIASLAEIEWIANGVRQKTAEPGCAVAHLIPPVFPAYAKLFHPISRDLAVEDGTVTWQENEKASLREIDASKTPAEQAIQDILKQSTLVYGSAEPGSRLVRIRWAQLARDLGLPFVPTLSSWSFTRQFASGSWPKNLIGPEEGCLATPDRDALVYILQRYTKVNRCFFHVCLLATAEWRDDLMFEGVLDDACLFPENVPEARLTPTYWFPEDRAWLVCTDYDLTFTLVGGPESLVRDLTDSPILECVSVNPETRVDRDADIGDAFHGTLAT